MNDYSLLGLTCTLDQWPDHIGFLPRCQITNARGAFVFALWGAVWDKDTQFLPRHPPASWAAVCSWPPSCPRPLSSHLCTAAVACSLSCCSSSVLTLVHPTCWCHINTLKTLIDMWSFSWCFNGKPLQGPDNSWSSCHSQLTSHCSQIRPSARAFLAHPAAQACAHTVLPS